MRYYSSDTGDVTANGMVHVFNTGDMSIIDGDPADGDQAAPFDLSTVDDSIRRLAISPDGATVYVGFNGDVANGLAVLDVATAGITRLVPPDSFATVSTGLYAEMSFGSDGRLIHRAQAVVEVWIAVVVCEAARVGIGHRVATAVVAACRRHR